MRVRGKVLEAGLRESGPDAPTRYRYGWVRILDRHIGEMVEVSTPLEADAINPFEALSTGQQFECETSGARLYKGVLTTRLAVVADHSGSSAELEDVDANEGSAR